ncbi:unnamed protein product [Tetraodon nigroviridis]|uniref:phosphatidate cytidylyltransferase n=1 Tax=Tetraodon nigroviridis TaxID=99883 RepID=Q4RUY7_TETNG|nr:unnamed protein product [Tetraodon nigroviridis]
MTELRKRGGGGGDPDSADNISDKVKGPAASRGRLVSPAVMTVQIKCFEEIITIGYSVYHSYDLPWFRTLSWYFLICVNYFFYGETLADYFGALVQREEPLQFLSRYHRFISFALYLAGFCMFVLSLVKKHYRLQFYMFAWTHVTLLIVVTQSHLVIQNLFEGMIWFIVPISIVICNDITAYLFGFFFGRTPLIKLSPKKTWEGFIGGFFSTVVFGFLLAYLLSQFQYFVCPVGFSSETNRFTVECEPSDIFVMQEYTLPAVFQNTLGLKKVSMYPFQIHSIFLSSFASLIGPFGGFFASGFKRAFKIKVICYSLYGTLSGLWLDSLHLSSPLGLCQHYPRPRRHHGSLRLPVPDGHLHPRLHRQLHPVGGGPEAGRGPGGRCVGITRGWIISAALRRSCRCLCRGPNPSKLLQQLLLLQP